MRVLQLDGCCWPCVLTMNEHQRERMIRKREVALTRLLKRRIYNVAFAQGLSSSIQRFSVRRSAFEALHGTTGCSKPQSRPLSGRTCKLPQDYLSVLAHVGREQRETNGTGDEETPVGLSSVILEGENGGATAEGETNGTGNKRTSLGLSSIISEGENAGMPDKEETNGIEIPVGLFQVSAVQAEDDGTAVNETRSRDTGGENETPPVPISSSEESDPASGNKAPPDEQNATKQIFDYFVVIDFEATCDSNIFFPQEIIEFPSVLVRVESLSVEDSFQTYVKPIYHPQLTEFCKRLTGIEQTQVDNGVSLADALEKHDKWLEDKGVKDKKFGVVTWTDWDCKIMLEFECKLKGLKKPPYFNKWINLKPLFQTHYGEKYNLKRAVLRAGLQWEGREHCGLDDAKNTASLAMELVRRGIKLSYTAPFKPNPNAVQNSELFLPKLKQVLEALAPSSDTAAVTRLDIGNALCFCGVRCKTRLVKKPGPNQGKYFMSCGNWTITEGGKCTFFEWVFAENVS